jgi:thiamine biosynthesis lipoprotein
VSAAYAQTSFPALGTTAVVVTEERAGAEATRLLRAELEAIDRACSRFRADSELSWVNASAGRVLRISRLLADAIGVALRAAERTGGAVDPTVEPALAALGYDRDFAAVPPDAAAGVRGRPAAGWRTVTLDARNRLVRLDAGTRLDLGATAKALAADRAAAAIAAATGSATLVSLGGDIATAGAVPDGGWPVHVTDDHRSGLDAPGQRIALRGGALATSSTGTRHWRRGGRTVHHIVDPATGEPAAPAWRTVSVAAGSCVDANTASTAAIVRGADAPAWLRSVDLPARLVDGSGAVVHVGEWPEAAA